MRVLIVDKSGDGLLDLAIRAQALGHNVRYFLQCYDPQKRPVGRGLVERVSDFRPSMRWADLVLLAGNGSWMREMDAYRAEGIPIIGGGVESASWELDRNKGMAILKKAGIPVPAYREAKTYDEAISLAKSSENGVAIKPSGDVADKSLSFVAKSPEEAIWRLQRWKRAGRQFGQGLILQERIDGVEFAVGGWFGPSGFVDGIEENWEGKRFFPGDLGPNTGEMYTVMRLVNKSKLFDKVLKPAEDQLHRLGFIGNCDVNCILDPEGNPWPLEWTMRFGYPAINVELALHQSDPVEFLACVAAGDKPPPRLKDKIAVGVVLAIPPFPNGHERAEEVVNVPIWGVTPSVEDNLHFCDVMMSDGQLATAGSYVAVATGVGSKVTEARDQALRVLNRLRIPASPFWRIDAGSRLRRAVPQLQEHGYALGVEY